MRKDPLITNQYYHIYNRGVDKRDVFTDKRDLYRFILSIKAFNTVTPLGSLRGNEDKGRTRTRKKNNKGVLVSIVCYCLNPNHFHFILKQEADGGISEFIRRLIGGYTKYFNERHKRSGALFQGKFKSHPMNSDEYFLKIFPYVNVNHLTHNIPREKFYLARSSDREYEKMNFDLVSEKEAKNLLEFYGGRRNFKRECINMISLMREQRSKDKTIFP